MPRYQVDVAGNKSGAHSGYRRYKEICRVPVPPFVEKDGLTERNLAWAFRG